MANAVTNVYAKSNYCNRLHINKALGLRKYGNSNKKNKKPKNNVRSDWRPLPAPKWRTNKLQKLPNT